MTALEKLEYKNREGKFICVGLDTDAERIPQHLRNKKESIFEFNRQIIETTVDNCSAYKINLAFYECYGLDGLKQLEKTLEIIPSNILTIGDAKRGDIGNTSRMYAKSIILALTSNKGADDFEKLKLKDERNLYQLIIEKTNEWNASNNCGLVFGATQTEELKENFHLFNQMPVLVPGVGAQGGSIEDVMRFFSKRDNMRLIINVSRGIIYKDNTENFADAAGEELKRLNNIVTKILKS